MEEFIVDRSQGYCIPQGKTESAERDEGWLVDLVVQDKGFPVCFYFLFDLQGRVIMQRN